jgi:KDO2-lipid IV(A) lauroyltransferase
MLIAIALANALGIGAWIGSVIWLASASYRRKSLTHMALAGYPLQGPLPRLVRANTGRLIADVPALWFWPNARLFARLPKRHAFGAFARIERAKREKRGLLFMTPHLGSFEVIPRYIAQMCR